MIEIVPKIEIGMLRRCAEAFFAESKLPGKLDFTYWVYRWSQFYDLGVGNILAYMSAGEAKGILGGFYVPCPMTGEMEAIEAFWYVLPEARGGRAGVSLIKAFEEEAVSRGCKRIKMAYLAEIPKTAELFKHLGYESLQTNVAKELP